MTDEQWQGMLNAQCTWDATMGFNAVAPLKKDDDPKAVMVVLVGAGHVQYGLGIERQIKPWFSGKVASVIPLSVEDDKKAPVSSVQASFANFVWGIPAEGAPLYPDLGISTRAREDKQLEIIDVEKDSPAARAGLKAAGRAGVVRRRRGRRIAKRSRARWPASAGATRPRVVVRRGEANVPVPVLLRREPPRREALVRAPGRAAAVPGEYLRTRTFSIVTRPSETISSSTGRSLSICAAVSTISMTSGRSCERRSMSVVWTTLRAPKPPMPRKTVAPA